MAQQIYALVSRINYRPLSIELFHYPEDAIKAARMMAYDASASSPSDNFQESIYKEDAVALMCKARALNFPNVIYAALWGETENIALVAEFDVQGSLSH